MSDLDHLLAQLGNGARDDLAAIDAELVRLNGRREHLQRILDAAIDLADLTPDLEPAEHACELCERTFPTEKGLQVHVARAHPDRPRPDPILGEWVCPECEATFVNPQGRAAHRRAKHGVAGSSPATRSMRQGSLGDVQCPDCPRKFPTSQAMRSHHGQVHGQVQVTEPAQVAPIIEPVDDEDAWEPSIPPVAVGTNPEHRLAETRRVRGGHIARCACMWETAEPWPDKADAVGELRDHVDERAELALNGAA